MNSLKGLGVCVVLACATFAITHVARIDHVVLVITLATVATSTLTFLASVRRFRLDRRAAGEGRRRRAAPRSANPKSRASSNA